MFNPKHDFISGNTLWIIQSVIYLKSSNIIKDDNRLGRVKIDSICYSTRNRKSNPLSVEYSFKKYPLFIKNS